MPEAKIPFNQDQKRADEARQAAREKRPPDETAPAQGAGDAPPASKPTQ
ncbi:MAG TPA: hypothetical protein VJN18_11225 [Polyangiaceae bacterium]|nr:hypothetical protein [Polyangiaceae bacterium]